MIRNDLGPHFKIYVTLPFSIKFKSQIENEVSNYRLLKASIASINSFFWYDYTFCQIICLVSLKKNVDLKQDIELIAWNNNCMILGKYKQINMFIYLLLTSALQSNMNRISGVMVSMLTSSVIDPVFEPDGIKPKTVNLQCDRSCVRAWWNQT